MNENKINEDLIEFKEYYLKKDNKEYKFIIGKKENEIIIKCQNFEIKLNKNDLSKITNYILKSVDDCFKFVINLFEENKVKIKDIIINKTIKILFKFYNKKQNFEESLTLNYNSNKKNEIEQSKNKNNFKSQNPKDIQFLKDLSIDSFVYHCFDNTFITFKSKYNILYLIYTNKYKSIISYDIINNRIINEIKKAHDNYILNFRHYFDKINKEDLIISISLDNNIKLWNIKNMENILNLKNINVSGWIFSACFLNNNNQNYILTSNSDLDICESIKVFDFKGNKIKEINDSAEITYFIDSYYDHKLSNNYIITGNKGFAKSYDYNNNGLFHKYDDNKDKNYEFDSAIINNKEEIMQLIGSSRDGNIRIWNFYSGVLLNKIKIDNCRLYGICLWNKDYLFVGCDDKNIKLIDLNKGIVIKDLIGHNKSVAAIKKIIHPQYGECLLSQNIDNSQIKLWIIF